MGRPFVPGDWLCLQLSKVNERHRQAATRFTLFEPQAYRGWKSRVPANAITVLVDIQESNNSRQSCCLARRRQVQQSSPVWPRRQAEMLGGGAFYATNRTKSPERRCDYLATMGGSGFASGRLRALESASQRQSCSRIKCRVSGFVS